MSWPYIAGYFDGEGCLLLGIHRDKREKSTKGSEVNGWCIGPALSISSGDYEVFFEMEKFLNSENIKTAKMDLRKKRKNQTKDFMRLNVMGWDNISKCIKNILPYSIAKRKQLELYFELVKIVHSKPCSKTKRNTHGIWTKELFMKAMVKIDEINNLKSGLRGKMNANYFKILWSKELGMEI